ncbi:hypothetical protein ABZ689_05895 [Streptomyces sp. NPDC006874]|uniref:hypothetical protein n=1 Tax=Streptomyces sp. NPDC006874 TaxID=3157189 RepID=UPI0033D0D3F1
MTTQPERDRLHHLLDRARRGVILPDEGEVLATLVGELKADLDRYEEVVGELNEANTTLQREAARGDRLYYSRNRWADHAGRLQERALTAEARVRELETASAPEVDRRPLHARHVAALTDAYPDLRHTADHIANISLAVRDEHVRELEQRVAELTAGQCTHALAVCEQHHRVPVAGCPYPQCKAAAARTA